MSPNSIGLPSVIAKRTPPGEPLRSVTSEGMIVEYEALLSAPEVKAAGGEAPCRRSLAEITVAPLATEITNVTRHDTSNLSQVPAGPRMKHHGFAGAGGVSG